jgi:protein-S-isoprenylcysteine O-methyltransferase Ste14
MRVSTFLAGAGFLTAVFVLLPAAFIWLNAALGLPIVEFPGSHVVGACLLLAGIALAAGCSRLFQRVGHGTPVPIEPPKALVVSGPYRVSRNPIYVADVVFLLGLFLYRGEVALLLYAAVFVLAVHFVIVSHEEPVLERRFGEDYRAYCRKVPRWIRLRHTA